MGVWCVVYVCMGFACVRAEGVGSCALAPDLHTHRTMALSPCSALQADGSSRLAGMQSLYNFWAYPSSTRLRLSQVGEAGRGRAGGCLSRGGEEEGA